MEIYGKAVLKSSVDANYNLVLSLILDDNPKAIMDELEGSPNAVGVFVNERITPFFGLHRASAIEKL